MNPALNPETLKSFFTDNLPDFLEMLREMVAINSFTSNSIGVNKLAELTVDHFARLGFGAETVQSTNPLYGRHLILTHEGQPRHGKPAPKIGLVSHLDTVFPADEEARNDFDWRVEGNRIYGPGVVDIKGGTVLIYMMLSAMRTLLPELFTAVTWVVMFDASEETGGHDFGRLCVQHLADNPLACLIFEGGNRRGRQFKVVVARKGMAVYRLTVDGKAAHAGGAHKRGANAVVQMADVIQHVNSFTDYDRDLTFNVGTVAGGTVINRVPHFAAASVEMRAFDTAVYDDAMARMLALNDFSSVSSANGDYKCRVQVMATHKVAPWQRNQASLALFEVWRETAVTLDYKAIPEQRGGLSDGNYFWKELPTLDGLGPAGGNAHCSERSADGSKEQEYVLIDSFVPKALLNTMAIINLIQSRT